MKKATVECFWEKVRKKRGKDGCWMWIGALTDDGYGKLHIGARFVLAHRFSYELSLTTNAGIEPA